MCIFLRFQTLRGRVVLDSWVVSQIWLDSDWNESCQSRVGRENQGYESSQSWVTLIVIWVRVESTRYCLSQSWVNDFSRRKRQDLAVICNFTGKEPTYSYIRPHPPPPPGKQLFPKLGKMWWVVSQIWLNSDSTHLSQSWVRLVNLGFELSRSWVRLGNLGFELSRSWVTWIVIWVRVESARKKWVEHNPATGGILIYPYLMSLGTPGVELFVAQFGDQIRYLRP